MYSARSFRGLQDNVRQIKKHESDSTRFNRPKETNMKKNPRHAKLFEQLEDFLPLCTKCSYDGVVADSGDLPVKCSS